MHPWREMTVPSTLSVCEEETERFLSSVLKLTTLPQSVPSAEMVLCAFPSTTVNTSLKIPVQFLCKHRGQPRLR